MKVSNWVYLSLLLAAQAAPMIALAMRCEDFFSGQPISAQNQVSYNGVGQTISEVLSTGKASGAGHDSSEPRMSISSYETAEKTGARLVKAREKGADGLSRPAMPFEFGIAGDKSLVISIRSDQANAKDAYDFLILAHSRGELVPLMKDHGTYRIQVEMSFSPSESFAAPAQTFKMLYLEMIPDKNGDLIVASYDPNIRPLTDSSLTLVRLGEAEQNSVGQMKGKMTKFFSDVFYTNSHRVVNHTAQKKLKEVLGFELGNTVRSSMNDQMAIDLLNSLGFDFNPMASSSKYWEKTRDVEGSNRIVAALKKMNEQDLVYVSTGFVQYGLYRRANAPTYLTSVTGGVVYERGTRRQTDNISETAMYRDLIQSVENERIID